MSRLAWLLLLASVVVFGRPAASEAQVSGLVAAFSFNETAGTVANDASGAGNHGTVTGATWSATGKYGGALSFNGISNLVTIADANSLDLTTGMTLEAWVKPASLSGWRNVVLKEMPGYLTYAMYASDGSAPAGYIYNSALREAKGTAALSTTAWTHIATTFNGSKLLFYVNGSLVRTTNTNGAILTSSGRLTIGGNYVWPDEFFAGLIDEVRVYNRALSVAEITTDMNKAIGGSSDAVPPTVSITAPAGGASVSGTVSVTATAADNVGVAGVTFKLDGTTTIGVEDTTSPYAVSWNTSTVANGAHTLTAIARDAAGNTTTSTPVSVTVNNTAPGDTTPPTVSITAPTNAASVSGQVTLAATAADNVGVAGVTFKVDGTTVGAEDTGAPYNIAWDTSTATPGAHTLTAVARDAAGNSTTSTPVSVTVTVDPNAPSQVGQWSSVQDWPLVAVHSTLMNDGRVLLWDGWEYGTTYAKVWNPADGTFLDVPINSQIFCGAQSVLPDGRILVTGGHSGTGDAGVVDASIFDPASNTWTRLANMSMPRWYPASVELKDGRVVVISGEITPGMWADYPDMYNPFTNSWSTLNVNTGNMHDTEYPLSFLAPNGKIVSISASLGITRVLDTDVPSWTNLGNVGMKGSAATYAPGKIIYTGGGSGAPSSPSGPSAMLLDMNAPSPTWRTIAPMSFGRFTHNMVALPDGKMLVVGGGATLSAFETGNGVRTPELFDPTTETFKQMAPQAQPRMYHSTALLLPDGRVLSAGGGRLYPAVDYKTAEIYSPPYLFKGARPTITAAPATAQYGTNISVTTPNAAGIASVSLVGLGSVTHTIDMNQRFVPLSFTKGAGTLSVSIPANANVAPPGPYMLFIVDSNGVPSVASMLRLNAQTETTPPTVSLTSPTAGATLSGTSVQLSANASDASGIASVEFKANGNSLGFATTSSPYALTWNTTTAANGPYTLTAIARDTFGNTATSAPVSVTVTNTGPQLPAGLVLGLPFKEGAGTSTIDVSGNNHTSTISGATWTTAGRYGNALSFDGVNDMVTVNDSALLHLTTGMTLSAWVKPNALQIWPALMVKERPGDLTYALYANTPTPHPAGYVATSTGFYESGGGPGLPLNTWSHVAVTYDGTFLRTYVNGVQQGSAGASGPILTSNNPLRIGGDTVWANEYFNGAIDEVRVYNRPLSPSEITADMNTALP